MDNGQTLSAAEEWRPVVGYEGLYEVSSHGRVRTAFEQPAYPIGHVLSPWPDVYGYPIYRLSRKGSKRRKRPAHKLVAEAFLGPCPPGHEVNHKDGIKARNHLDNLEYITHGENVLHARRNGLWKLGASRKQAVLTEQDVREIRRLCLSLSQKRVGDLFGICQQHVSDIVRRKIWADVV